MIEPIITLEDFMNSPYNDILNADVILDVNGERIEVTEEVSTPDFFKKFELMKVSEIRPMIKKPAQEDIEEEYGLPEVNVHFELAFLVVLEKYVEVEESEEVVNV